jgi:hypothetical protein
MEEASTDTQTPTENPAVPNPEKSPPETNVPGGKKTPGKWFRKIPRDVIFSPGGAVLIFFAIIMELIDLIPLEVIDAFTWELILEIIFLVLLALIAKIPFQTMIIPIVIERIPIISDILPTWVIKLFF